MEVRSNTPMTVWTIQWAAHAIGLWMGDTLRQENLSQGEAHVMAYLTLTGGCAMNDLHRHFGHRRSTLTNLVDRLEARALLTRKPHPQSRRSVMVEPTATGRQSGEIILARLREVDAWVREATAPEDRSGFRRVTESIWGLVHER